MVKIKYYLASLVIWATAILASSTHPPLNFGQHYAVLNLDLVDLVISTFNTTESGQRFIKNTATWIDAVHKQTPPPLSIFTRVYFSNSQRPKIGPGSPLWDTISAYGNITEKSPGSQVYPAFKPLEDWDVVLRKSSYYAGRGNSLEEILSSQKIDTVILSGVRTSGVVLSTAYTLFDLNYKVYVISNNTFELPPNGPAVNEAILAGILPKLPANVITVDEAIDALQRSGPAVY